jgi:hypothetical protein
METASAPALNQHQHPGHLFASENPASAANAAPRE